MTITTHTHQQLRRTAEDARDNREKAVITPDQLDDLLDAATASPRPLTADDITDEMERRLIRKGVEFAWFSERDINDRDTRDKVRALLTAALTEPTRPEWEEEGAKALTIAVWGMNIPNEAGEAGDKLAASLARHGYQVVRVTGGN